MLTTIKGVYEHGKIFLSEESPVKTRTDVMITFMPDSEQPNNLEHKKQRVLGLLEGKIKLPDDFNEPLDELKDYM